MLAEERAASVCWAALLLLGIFAHAGPAWAQPAAGGGVRPDVARELARAERAYDEEDAATAEQAYAAVLAADHDNPRALFRLAQLRRKTPDVAIELLVRYVALVPKDAWGHLALATAYADAGRPNEAITTYDRALALEPEERDIALGGPRLRARLGETDAAIRGYRRWLVDHEDDDEAWSELAEQLQRGRMYGAALEATQRAVRSSPRDERLVGRLQALRGRTAPAAEIGLLGTGETDVTTFGGALGADAAVGDGGRVGVSFQQRRISSLGDVATTQRLLARASFAPRADLHIQLSGGIVRSSLEGAEALDRTRPEATMRVRHRSSRAVVLDVRGQHGPVDVTPLLAVEDLMRSQVSAALELPAGQRLLVRASGRLALMSRPRNRNVGTRFGGGLATALGDGMHASCAWQQSRYSEPAVGYFAPQRTDVIEGGLDLDRDWDSFTFALDAGAGFQRVLKFGSGVPIPSPSPSSGLPPAPGRGQGRGNAGGHGDGMGQQPAPEPAETSGTWGPALRAWGLLGWTLRPGRMLAIEFETYDSQVSDGVIATEQWRYASVTVSLRLAIR